MSRYVVTRFLLMIPTLLAVAVLIFLLVRVVPGDIVELRLVSGGTYVTKDVIQAERARLGLNKPIWNQFVDWMVGLVRAAFGVSLWGGGKVAHQIARRPLRNAALPVTTVTGLAFAFLIGGLVVTEQVFNLNGIGKLIVDAISHRDYTLIPGLMLLGAAGYILANFIVDIVYAWLDPRISYG